MKSAIRESVAAGLLAAALAGCAHDTKLRPVELANLIEVSGSGQFAAPTAPVPESLVVKAIDGQGNGMAGVTVTWSAITGGGTVHPAAATTDANGRLAAQWVLGSVGANVVSATAGTFTVTFTATATVAPPTKLALITQPTSGLSGAAFSPQPVVEIQSSSGTPIFLAGVTVTATLASGSGFASLGGSSSAVTGGNGRATFSGLKLTGPVGNYTVRFSAASLAAVVSGPIDLTTTSGRTPLTDMGSRTYFGFTGGLFANGSNTMPSAHAAAGAARVRLVKRLDLSGNPSASGKIVLLSVGFSNPAQEWCDVLSFPCNSWTFTGQAAADPAVNHAAVAIVNGASGGSTAEFWRSPTAADYDRVKNSVLAPLGLSEAQVQVIWIKTANPDPVFSLPDAQADAIRLVTQNGDILRAMKVRYPNLQMVFMSSRIYAGYANTGQNPEPYAYETGFADKWTIQAQIDQMANGGTIVDSRAGNLNYTTVAPWISWGPYMWADGLNPRTDGLTWVIGDFEADGTHPGTGAETKVGTQLLNFFKTDPRTACWFRSGQSCP